jgi:hypothetical protein
MNKKMANTNKTFHISMDDVGPLLFNEYKSQKRTLSNFLMYTHENYQVTWDLYFFSSWDSANIYSCDLSNLFNKVSARIGCHAPSKDIRPYELNAETNIKWVAEFYETVKHYDICLSKNIRLHYHSEIFRDVYELLVRYGVNGFFLTDKSNLSFSLGGKHLAELSSKGFVQYENIVLWSSGFRIENLMRKNFSRKDLQELFIPYSFTSRPLVIYTHEYEFQYENMYEYTVFILDVLINDLGFRCEDL